MSRPLAKEALLEAVENQLQSGDPPETRQTLDRLLKAGRSREEAMEGLAWALLCQLDDVLREQKPFNHKRFVGYLNQLR